MTAYSICHLIWSAIVDNFVETGFYFEILKIYWKHGAYHVIILFWNILKIYWKISSHILLLSHILTCSIVLTVEKTIEFVRIIKWMEVKQWNLHYSTRLSDIIPQDVGYSPEYSNLGGGWNVGTYVVRTIWRHYNSVICVSQCNFRVLLQIDLSHCYLSLNACAELTAQRPFF